MPTNRDSVRRSPRDVEYSIARSTHSLAGLLPFAVLLLWLLAFYGVKAGWF